MSLSGGCQCGAVRFRVDEVGRAGVCHCRMCQKAMGAPFGAFVTVRAANLTWTRGEPKHFQSSNTAKRGFCEGCGTPLTYEWRDEELEVAICAFDEPRTIEPALQFSAESALPWVARLHEMPWPTAEQAARIAKNRAQIRSNQHPDHDT